MSQEVKLEAEKPTVKLEPGPSEIFETGPSTNLEANPSVKTETDGPAVKMEPGPSVVMKPKPKTEAEQRQDEDEMEISADEDSEEDSDNPDNYHPVIFCNDPYDDGDPYREPTDVGHLVVDLGTGKKMNFEKDDNGDYKCPETSCKYSTKKVHLLGRHYKTHNKQYECKVCAKKFSQREMCMNHIRTHDDRWKFRCDECRKRFAVYRQLKTHCLSKHGIEVESRRRQWIIVPPGYERPMAPLPRMNSRGKLW